LALLRVELAAFHSAFSWAGPQESDIVTVALVLALRRTGVTRYLALGSSDFPQPDRLPDQAAAIRPPSLTRRFYRRELKSTLSGPGGGSPRAGRRP